MIAIAFWPIAHYGLVSQLDLNPWKLHGFAMYCTPHLLTADLYDTSSGRPRRLDSRRLPEPARRAWRSFLERRYVLGRLAPPDEAARAVLEALQPLRSIRIDLTVERLGFFDTTTVSKKRSYAFERDTS